MKYLDYRGMKEFYTIDEVCRLFEISRQVLKHYADKYSIQPQEDQYGNWGFRKGSGAKAAQFHLQGAV